MVLKKIILAAGLAALATAPAAASDIIVDNLGGGHYGYIGKGDRRDVIGSSDYDIYNMSVSRSDAGLMTVRINTRFVDINNRPYRYGDLLMSVKGEGDLAAWDPYGSASYGADDFQTTGTTWEYAYDLNGARNNEGSFTDTTDARLVSLDNPENSSSFHYGSVRYDGSSRNDHIWMVNDRYSADLNSGLTHSVEASTGGNYLEFIFDVSGTRLATAEQIAFHWTMSCANDIIEGVANFNRDVPAPAAGALLLMGLGGVGFVRRRQRART